MWSGGDLWYCQKNKITKKRRKKYQKNKKLIWEYLTKRIKNLFISTSTQTWICKCRKWVQYLNKIVVVYFFKKDTCKED